MNGFIKAWKTAFTNATYTGLMWLVLRLFVGYEFVTAGWEKVTSGQWLGFDNGGAAIQGFLGGALKKAATGEHPEVQGWYAGLVQNVFLPNATLFANMVAIGETLVGVALILGVFTKFSAAMGATMNLAFLAAGVSSSNPQMLVFQVAMVFGGAGVAYYGLDHFVLPYLRERLHITTTSSTPTITRTPRQPLATPAR